MTNEAPIVKLKPKNMGHRVPARLIRVEGRYERKMEQLISNGGRHV